MLRTNRVVPVLVRLIVFSVFLLTVRLSLAEDGSNTFDKDIAPILIDHCLECHGGTDPEGGLSLLTAESVQKGGDSGSAITPGDATQSLLWQRVSGDEMPPQKPLSKADKQTLRQWIQRGAVWGTSPIDAFRVTTNGRAGYDWWSLQPVTRPEVPAIRDAAGRNANPIDAFVIARLTSAGLTQSPRATPRELMRRLSFDLIGLPPSPEDLVAFEQLWHNDRETAWDDLIETLLSSEQFGERWGRHWLDVVRFGESQGFERDKLRDNLWHYRDWVIDAMNRDMPYDEFVRQQLAGDILYPGDPDAITATGFLVAGPWDEVGQSQQSAAMKAVVRQDELEDYVGTIGQTFLGLTVNCARCHNHKFDPISQKEYYRLASAVGGVRHGSRDVNAAAGGQADEGYSVYAVVPRKAGVTHLLHRGNPSEPGDAVSPGGVAAISGVDADFGLSVDSSDADRRRKLAEWVTGRDNPLFARTIVNRLWHYHFGTGLVETPNDFGFNGGRPSHPELIDWLAAELIESNWSLKHIHRLIVTSETWQQSSRHRPECAAADADNRLLWRKSPIRLEAEALRDTILSVSGQLNLQYGGPPYRDFTTHVHNTQFYTMVDLDTPDVYRRTVYRTWIRSGRNHMLDTFDCPDPSATAPRRAVTTTPLQSLTLMNNSFVLRMSQRFAQRVIEEAGDDPHRRVTRVAQLAFGRNPTDDEMQTYGSFVAQNGLAAFCRVVFNSNEFIYVD